MNWLVLCVALACAWALWEVYSFTKGARVARIALEYIRKYGPSRAVVIAEEEDIHPCWVYTALRRMERAGLLTSFEAYEALEARGGRPRRYYGLKKGDS